MTRYTRTAIALHWLVAALVFVAFPLGVYMHDLPLSPAKLRLISYHKWLGVTVFVLAIARIAWRLTHTPPRLPAMPRWQAAASQVVHGLLYGLLLAVPLSGWLMSSAKGIPTVWFGVVPLPDLIGRDRALAETLVAVHKALNITLLVTVAVHVAAALKHQFIDRDGLMSRMSLTR
jgi:cytochrome b561